jgi:phage terminase large subunit GpA-like protein
MHLHLHHVGTVVAHASATGLEDVVAHRDEGLGIGCAKRASERLDRLCGWEKEPGRRNEALDCRVYARAAAAICGLDRFEDRHWRRMEEALARTVERDDHETASPRTPAVRPPARQVIHSGYMAR